jgi:hypothetical protein
MKRATLDSAWTEVPLHDATATSVEITSDDPMALFQIRSGQ